VSEMSGDIFADDHVSELNRIFVPAAKKTPKKTVKKSAKAPMSRGLSASHKRALSEGRRMSATVDRYLAAVTTPKRRGRKVPQAVLVERLAAAQVRAKTATGVERVLVAQEVRDLSARIAGLTSAGDTDLKESEHAFVRIAKDFGERRGIGYGAWRDAGVPAAVLKRAGVARTRRGRSA
jgi:hypothetical protein